MTNIGLHQMLEAALIGDATTDQAFLIQRWLRQLGFRSEIYAEHFHPGLEKSIKLASSIRLSDREPYLIYHHAIGSDAADRLISLKHPLILIYHNITPPEFFITTEPSTARQLRRGREQLALLQELTVLSLADSSYSVRELEGFCFRNTGVLPIVLAESLYQYTQDEAIMARFSGRGPYILFVGRLAPNKKQEDLIKLLYYYRRIEPEAKLILVGSPSPTSYFQWLEEFASSLELDDAVIFTNHISQREMVTYYQIADIFVSMSEHEGFGKPLIESMYFHLPVLAYNAAAVAYTMENAGLLFQHKHFEALAEVIDLVINDLKLRQLLIHGQDQRVLDFSEAKVRDQFEGYLRNLVRF